MRSLQKKSIYFHYLAFVTCIIEILKKNHVCYFSTRLVRKLERIRPPTDPQYAACIKKKDHTKNTKMCYLAKNESIGKYIRC